jgi:hypothetical protein
VQADELNWAGRGVIRLGTVALLQTDAISSVSWSPQKQASRGKHGALLMPRPDARPDVTQLPEAGGVALAFACMESRSAVR